MKKTRDKNFISEKVICTKMKLIMLMKIKYEAIVLSNNALAVYTYNNALAV